MAAQVVAVVYVSCSPWHQYESSPPWPPQPVRVYFMDREGRLSLQATPDFECGESGYQNRYGYSGDEGTISDPAFEPSNLEGTGDYIVTIGWSASLGDVEAIYASAADESADVNPVRIHWEDIPDITCIRYSSSVTGPGVRYQLQLRQERPIGPEDFWTNRVGTFETSDKVLHKQTPVTTTTPEQAARAAQPYQPARKAWTETKTERVCWTETKVLDPGQAEQWVPSYNAKHEIERYVLQPARPAVVKNSRVCENQKITINHPAQPEVPAQPAVSYRPASVTQLFGLGWNAGARSMKLMPQSGYFEFKVPQALGVVVGLNNADNSQDYGEISHGLQFTRQSFRVIENGEVKLNAGGYSPTEVFTIGRRGNIVTYWASGALMYTSTLPSSGPVFLDSSIYSSGDRIAEAKLTLTESSSGSFVSTLRPMGGLLSDHPYSIFRSEMHPLGGGLSALRSRFVSRLRAMEGMLTDKVYGSFAGTMAGLGGSLDARGAPPYALFFSQLFPLSGVLGGMTGGVFSARADMRPMESLWADRPYGDFRSPFGMMPMFGSLADAGYLQRPVPLPGLKLRAQTGAQAVLTLPAVRATAKASRSDVGAEITLPALLAGGQSGVQVSIKLPAVRANGEATASTMARAEIKLPAVVAYGSATAWGQAEAALVLPAFAAVGQSGARATVQLPAVQALGSATAEGMAAAAIVLPTIRAFGEAFNEAFARAELMLPAVAAGGWVEAVLTLPAVRGRIEFSVEDIIEHEAYAINLRSSLESGGNEVTRYTHFPFNRIVRWRGQYVAMAADGLYLLGGATDAGVQIPWRIRTGTTDFGKPQNKNTASAYVGGRMGPASTFRVFTGEKLDNSYPYTTPRGETAQNYRQKFGRGLDARYYALEIAGDGEFQMDDLDVEVVAKRTRRI